MSVGLLRERNARPRIARPIVVAILALASSSVGAQQPPIDRAGKVLEQTKEPLQEPLRLQRPAQPVTPKPPEPRPALPVSPTLKVRVTQFTFSGNTLFPEEELQQVVEEHIGQELDFEGLNDVATKVRAYFRTRGYFLAQAYLPQQAIRNGSVEIAIIEGRVGVVELQRRPASRLAEWLLAGILDANLKSGDIITETGLERPLLLINDLPTATVTSEIRPSQELGAADLRVNVDQGVGLLNGYFDLDNHGSRFTGEYRVGASVNMNNPVGIGDQVTFRTFITDEDMHFYRIAYLVPAGFWGTRVGVSYTKFDYVLAKDFSTLQAFGNGVVKSVYALHPFYRTRNTNFIGQLAYETKDLRDQRDFDNVVEDRKIEAVKFGAVGDWRDSWLRGGLNTFALSYTNGNLTLEPPTVAAADIGPTGLRTQGRFYKTNWEYRRVNRVTEDTSVLIAYSGQDSSKNLASAEKMSLGGANGVRAYPSGEGTGDDGHLVQTEFRYIVPQEKFLDGDIMMFALYDWGRVRVNHRPLDTDIQNRREIGGWGFGASLGKEGSFVIRGTVAWRAEREGPQADRAQRDPRVFVQAIKWF